MITIQDIELIENFLEGKLNPDELKLFESRLKVDTELASQVENYKIAVESVKVYQRNLFKAKLGNIHKELINSGLGTPKKLFKIASYIGGVLILLTSAYLIFNAVNQSEPQSNSEITNDKVINEHNINNNRIDNSVSTSETTVKAETSGSSNSINKNDNLVADNYESGNSLSGQANNSQIDDGKDSKNGNNVVQTNSATKSGKAGDIPIVNFGISATSGCVPFSVNFIDSSHVKNSKISSWKWDFGDGQVSTLKNPVHTYTKNGIFTVSLTVISDYGESNTLSKSNYIKANPTPEALFEVTPKFTSLKNPKVTFTNKSKYITSGTKYTWDFGDNSGTSTQKSPIYNYSDTGRFLVVLQAKNEYNCMDNYSSPVIVSSYIDAYLPTAFSPTGQSSAVNSIYKVWADGFKEFHIWILNQEGVLLYESDDYATHGWNGSGGFGTQSPTGVYICNVTIVGVDGVTYKYKETVTLIR